jgi:hypothetical protein
MKSKRQILQLLCLVPFIMMTVPTALAQELSLSAEVSSASMPFEGKDTLRLRLSWAGEPYKYVLTDLPMPSLEKLEILGSSSTVASSYDSAASQETSIREYAYILGATDFGTAVIEPLELTLKNRLTGEDHVLSTGRLTVEVAEPKPREKQSNIGSVLLIAALLVVFIVGIVVFMLIRTKRKHQIPEIRTGVQYADSLEEIKRDTVSDAKLFYARVYRLLIKYVEETYRLQFAGLTGEEIIGKIAALEEEPEREKIAAWLRLSLEKKFNPAAGYDAQAEDMYRELKSFFDKKQTVA